MKIEDQCVSFELATELKDLGVKQCSYFRWSKTGTGKPIYELENPEAFGINQIAAFTVAELAKMLPPGITIVKITDSTWIALDIMGFNSMNEKMADVLAEMLIYLIQTGRMELPKCNE
jgi:hypothetical protein